MSSPKADPTGQNSFHCHGPAPCAELKGGSVVSESGKTISPAEPGGLRSRAEALLQVGTRPADMVTKASSDAARTLHELQVHHVELQLQNEELEAARQDAEAARDRWARLFELAPGGVLVLGRDGVILDANVAAGTLFQLPGGRLRGRLLMDFVDDDSLPDLTVLLATNDPGAQPRADLSLLDANQRPLRVQAVCAADPVTQQLMMALTDISERERLRTLQRSAMHALQDADRMKSEFLSRMSHELRTPLNAVLGFAHLQQIDSRYPLDPKNLERAGHIQQAGQHLQTLIEESLDLAAIESGRLKVTLVPVRMASLLHSCIALVEFQAEAAKVSLHVDFSAATAGVALADSQRLRQVLLNLMSNAVKYNRPGGDVRVDCRFEAATDQIEIQVADNGIGMSPEQQQRLFHAFDRLGAELTGVPGTGLGLMITRLLVVAMGGEIRIESAAGVGTRAWVRLPAARVTPVDEPDPAPGAPPGSDPA